MTDKRHDEVNHPAHYTSHPSGVECIEITRHMSFNCGNVVKYLWRAGLKVQPTDADSQAARARDLDKALWYLKDEIEHPPGSLPKRRRFEYDAETGKMSVDRSQDQHFEVGETVAGTLEPGGEVVWDAQGFGIAGVGCGDVVASVPFARSDRCIHPDCEELAEWFLDGGQEQYCEVHALRQLCERHEVVTERRSDAIELLTKQRDAARREAERYEVSLDEAVNECLVAERSLEEVEKNLEHTKDRLRTQQEVWDALWYMLTGADNRVMTGREGLEEIEARLKQYGYPVHDFRKVFSSGEGEDS